MGGQGRGREGRRPGVHIDDDGGDEETDGKPALREILPDDNKYIFTVSLCVLNIFELFCFFQEINIEISGASLVIFRFTPHQCCPVLCDINCGEESHSK